jgi:predicted Zn finger-like uncharacterized protein
MSAENTIKVRCPSCEAKYRVPAKAAGHRVRCTKCRSVFRVAKPASPSPADRNVVEVRRHAPAAASTTNGSGAASGTNGRSSRVPSPPTEDDILSWLNEGQEDNGIPARPRMASTTAPPPKPEVEEQSDETPKPKPEARLSKPKVNVSSRPLTPRVADPEEPPSLDAGELKDVLQFRKTG